MSRTGLSVESVLKQEIGRTFQLLDGELGKAKGKLWWILDETLTRRIMEVPLTERIEQAVQRFLLSSGRVEITDVLNHVFKLYQNSLTKDKISIQNALKKVGRQVGKRYWVMNADTREHIRLHSELIAALAIAGNNLGYRICIGRNERGDISSITGNQIKLIQLMDCDPRVISHKYGSKYITDIDLLWINEDNEVEIAYEIESTTTMISAVIRGSLLPDEIEKVMVIPESRQPEYARKWSYPAFAELYTRCSWNLVYFNDILNNYKHPEFDIESYYQET
ncbi:MAG: hypothetical protein KAW14_07990 [Candidatus Aegiribacteria sp.]|nr:hypothetical protein [Candidatus Aegiribacteria sp.]